MSVDKSYTVPCIEKVFSGVKCPNGGAELCKYSHKRICNYSVNCRLMNDAKHVETFYHPISACQNGVACQITEGNHWVSFAHPCFFRNCKRPTIAHLNGWLCGYHYSCITTLKSVNRAEASMPTMVNSSTYMNVVLK